MSDVQASAMPRLVAVALIWAGAFALHFGLSALLFPLLYNAHKLLPALQGWISDGESYIRIGSTLMEAIIALITSGYIVRLASRPRLLAALICLALLATHLFTNLHFVTEGAISIIEFIRGPLVAIALLWLGLWFWSDLMGWGKRAS